MAVENRRVVIKKYENRRLYDTANSRYVNLDDIAQMVRQGTDVQVLDAASGEDLTRLVLTQIIVEDVKEPGSGFPLDVLRQMVVASGRVSRETVVKYMKAMFDMYQNTYRAFTPGLMPFDFMQSMMGGAAPPQARPDDANQVVIQELRQRIDDLEKMVAQQGTAKKRKSRA